MLPNTSHSLPSHNNIFTSTRPLYPSCYQLSHYDNCICNYSITLCLPIHTNYHNRQRFAFILTGAFISSPQYLSPRLFPPSCYTSPTLLRCMLFNNNLSIRSLTQLLRWRLHYDQKSRESFILVHLIYY